MDFSNLAKLGGFLGGIAALGGMVVAILGYVGSHDRSRTSTAPTPVAISVSTSDATTQGTSETVKRLEGDWVAHPMEIYTDVSAEWLAKRGTGASNDYDATIIDASTEFERTDRNDELIANIRLVNDAYDHRFRGIVKVSQHDVWLLAVKHLKQYGAEPNLTVSNSEMEIGDNGTLHFGMTMPGYLHVSFIATPDGDSDTR